LYNIRWQGSGKVSFGCSSLSEVKEACAKADCRIEFSEDLSVLADPIHIGGHPVNNRFCVHPMEGCDAAADGSPSELTEARYMNFARGGSGLIWFEAVAVVPEGKAGRNQLIINENNKAAFARLTEKIRNEALQANGFVPVIIMQITHSGRFSKPDGTPRPIIAYHHPQLDAVHNIPEDLTPVSDEYLASLPEKFTETAMLAQSAGFDGADVKCCHRYLLSELLSAIEREGKYGGSFENRSRLFLDCVDAVRAAVDSGFIVGSRLNGFDALPGGFACDKNDCMTPDLTETLRLVRRLIQRGVDILNVTTGSPYYNPYVNRPNDVDKKEPPLVGVSRMFSVIGEIQKAAGAVPVVGTGYSYLREYIPFAAAGEILAGRCSMAGLGRMSFAYPELPGEILRNAVPNANKLCTTCGQCAALLRQGQPARCVVRENRLKKERIDRK